MRVDLRLSLERCGIEQRLSQIADGQGTGPKREKRKEKNEEREKREKGEDMVVHKEEERALTAKIKVSWGRCQHH
jgi:hypothetical protein